MGSLIRENGVSAAVSLMNTSTDSEDTANHHHLTHPAKVREFQQLEKGNPDLVAAGTHSNFRSQEVRQRNVQ